MIVLIFLGAFEINLISWFILFDAECKLMLAPDFSTYMNRDLIKTIKTLGVFILEIFDLGMKANHIQWTDSDIALFNAFLFNNPGAQKNILLDNFNFTGSLLFVFNRETSSA